MALPFPSYTVFMCVVFLFLFNGSHVLVLFR